MRPLIRILVVATVALSVPGCMFFTTKQEGEALRKQVRTLSTQVKALKAREQSTLAKLRAELTELKALLPKARQVLLRSSARFGVQLARLQSDVAKLQGRMENALSNHGGDSKDRAALKARVTKLAETVERVRTELTRLMAEQRKAGADPTTAEAWWARATRRRVLGQAAAARQDYQQLIRRHPRDPRVPAAYYHVAKTWFDAYDFKRAVVAVARLLKQRPASRYDARGRLLSARSYFELKRCRTAIRILIRAIRRHPHAASTPEARRLLARLTKIQKVARFCR